jgi:copper(I)-binding protein
MKKLLLLSLLLAFSIAQAQTTGVQFSDGWIKQLPPVIPMRAGYVAIKNTGATPKTIISMNSDAFDKVEIHETIMADGVMKMIELENLVIPPGGQVDLKPGGKHMMLIAPKKTMQIGDKIELQVNFDDGSQQRIMLEVKK